jgi:hypothetical protein
MLSPFFGQLVPAGYHVVPAGRPNRSSNAVTTAAEARLAARQQALDERADEAALLREPIVLSGTPYPYHVNVGKDVVSGKGGRVSDRPIIINNNIL